MEDTQYLKAPAQEALDGATPVISAEDLEVALWKQEKEEKALEAHTSSVAPRKEPEEIPDDESEKVPEDEGSTIVLPGYNSNWVPSFRRQDSQDKVANTSPIIFRRDPDEVLDGSEKIPETLHEDQECPHVLEIEAEVSKSDADWIKNGLVGCPDFYEDYTEEARMAAFYAKERAKADTVIVAPKFDEYEDDGPEETEETEKTEKTEETLDTPETLPPSEALEPEGTRRISDGLFTIKSQGNWNRKDVADTSEESDDADLSKVDF